MARSARSRHASIEEADQAQRSAVRHPPEPRLARARLALRRDKAQWCRYYLAGVEDRALTPPFGKRLPDWAHRAHRRGKDDATTRKADASHVAALDSRRSKRIQKREDRIDAMDDAAIERQVLLQERLSRLGGGDGELGPIAERLARGLAVAMGVPGMLGFNKK
jgi:hypothetical protein